MSSLTITFSEEETQRLQKLAAEHGFDDVEAYVRDLIDIEADEALWDEQFAKSQDVLNRLANEALAAIEAGEVEDFDPETDPDLQ